MKQQDARSLSPLAQQAVRQRAVTTVLNGTSRAKAAELFGVSRQAIYNWMRAYHKGGQKALVSKRRGHRGHIRLKPWQAALTVRLITDKLPDQLKLPFALWTREAVAQLIEQKFGLRLSVMTVGRYLKRWGFTPQKPARRATEQNQAEVDVWLREQYPAIRRQAAREKASIYWGDEMGVRSDHQTGRSYGRKGKTPVIPSTGKRFSCNMISAITNRGALKFMIFREHFTAEVFIEYLDRLVKSSQQKVYLIVDNHRVHRAKKVQIWLGEHAPEIVVHYLPRYSPELNPDEYLNNDVKSNAVGRKRAKDEDEMFCNLLDHMNERQSRPELIQNFFCGAFVKYAA